MRRPPRRRAAAALLGAAAMLLTACGGLSTSGPVQPGPEITSGGQPDVRQYFPGPQTDASQEKNVLGFIRAGAATDGDYGTARRFLTSRASESWNPDETIVLQSDDAPATIRRVDPATLSLTVHAAATVDDNGRYHAAEPGATVTATFSFVSVNGQWRIDSLPEGFGRWVKELDVSRLVQPFAVNYVSVSRRSTVPDVRWFPLDRLAPRLARAQLDPVPDFLRGAATSAVPAGTRLLGDAVSVSDAGVASVNLIKGSPIDPGAATRQNLYAQFFRTLTQDPEVSAVSLAADGVPVDVGDDSRPVSSLTRVGFPAPSTDSLPTKPVARRGSVLSVFDPGSTRQQPRSPSGAGSTFPPIAPAFTDLAMSADGSEFAAVDPGDNGISRWTGDNRYEVPPVGAAVSAPAYDRRGFLWFGAVTEDQDRLFVVDEGVDPADLDAAAPTPVVAEWLRGRRVVDVRPAADGDRVAVLSTRSDGTAPRVDLAGIVRGEGGRPQRLAAPLPLGVDFTTARGLVWIDDQTLATIAAIRGGKAVPTVLTVGGEVRPLTALAGARMVATTGSDRTIYVVTTKGRLFVQQGTQWVDIGPATDLASPAG